MFCRVSMTGLFNPTTLDISVPKPSILVFKFRRVISSDSYSVSLSFLPVCPADSFASAKEKVSDLGTLHRVLAPENTYDLFDFARSTISGVCMTITVVFKILRFECSDGSHLALTPRGVVDGNEREEYTLLMTLSASTRDNGSFIIGDL